MDIQILLNHKIPNYKGLQGELSGEIMALQGSGVTITTKTAPPPENTLGLGDVLQYIINNRDEITKLIPLLTAVVQILLEVFRRNNIIPQKPVRIHSTPKKMNPKSKKEKQPKPEPLAIILVGDHHLNFPCTTSQASNFVKKVGKGNSKKKVK